MLVLKEESREIFKKPFGKLYSALNEVDQDFLENHFIISIGDATTNNVLNADIMPNIGIIDNKIEREISKHQIEYNAITLNVDNPPGTITDELWETIEKAKYLAKEANVLIVVNGEEDLAVIPCVLMAPKNTLILYGQPGEGLVVVEADKIKDTAKKMLDHFRKC
ncbi:GTP-dependent dephospho-CoA kinase family protein [Methanobacterium sp.]|uniref:GTP-dependent dephospho-CoA kinase family protein n=1 Tax=Methanobacterium sp. TaxID=2164 RepID=UPI003C77963C